MSAFAGTAYVLLGLGYAAAIAVIIRDTIRKRRDEAGDYGAEGDCFPEPLSRAFSERTIIPHLPWNSR